MRDDGGMDLIVPAGPGLPGGLVVPGAMLVERFSRASGPGGQGVNTTDSRVELELVIASLDALVTEAQFRRLASALTASFPSGIMVVTAQEHRAQRRNRVAARERMAVLLRSALAPPPPARGKTKPTRGSQLRRLDAKRRRSETKIGRSRPRPDTT
ncbi:isoflavone 2'-hydroxylase-like [Platysternon megacephalum]|uniref:Isoflavone 2'-hydroxylase-like n=1 Tax=Platysternon megacephalum TaxID=55544 RepID=A0A4D9DJC3_9SAUR|nr:isoflavone 2'-hydroxylase-like [Platysternon megacephalum]